MNNNKNNYNKNNFSSIKILITVFVFIFLNRFVKNSSNYITEYKIINIYPKKTKTYLYLIEKPNGERSLLRTYNKKQYFYTYKSQLYSPGGYFAFEQVLFFQIKREFLREKIFNIIKNHPSPKSNEYILPIILGIKEDRSNFFQFFKKTGTWHLLCVGGLHINFVRKIIYFFRNIFLLKNPNKIFPFFYFLELMLIWLYGYCSNFQTPALRSLLMNSTNLFFRIRNSYIDRYNTYYVSFLFLLLKNRKILYDLGFQMSFIGVFMILYYGFYWNNIVKVFKYLYIKNKYILYFFQMLYINILISAGLILHTFILHQHFNILSPFLNVLSIPIFIIGICFYFLEFFLPLKLSMYVFLLLEQLVYYCHVYGFKIYFNFIKTRYVNYYILIYILLLISLQFWLDFVTNHTNHKQNKQNCSENYIDIY